MLSRIAALGLALMLTGCAQLAARYELQDLARAQVLVAEGFVVVSQEPLIVKRNRGDGKAADVVTWDVGSSGVQFDGVGITIDGLVKPLNVDPRRQTAAKPSVDTSQTARLERPCTVSADRTQVTCTLPRTLASGYYAYTIRVSQGGQTRVLDPTVMLE